MASCPREDIKSQASWVLFFLDADVMKWKWFLFLLHNQGQSNENKEILMSSRWQKAEAQKGLVYGALFYGEGIAYMAFVDWDLHYINVHVGSFQTSPFPRPNPTHNVRKVKAFRN